MQQIFCVLLKIHSNLTWQKLLCTCLVDLLIANSSPHDDPAVLTWPADWWWPAWPTNRRSYPALFKFVSSKSQQTNIATQIHHTYYANTRGPNSKISSFLMAITSSDCDVIELTETWWLLCQRNVIGYSEIVMHNVHNMNDSIIGCTSDYANWLAITRTRFSTDCLWIHNPYLVNKRLRALVQLKLRFDNW